MKRIGALIIMSILSCQRIHADKQTDSIDSLGKSIGPGSSRNTGSIKQVYPKLTDTLDINHHMFIVTQDDPRSDQRMNLMVFDPKGDTVYEHNGFASNGFEILGFDNNGIPDIKLNQISNVGGVSELIVFDAVANKFRAIKNGHYKQVYFKKGCPSYFADKWKFIEDYWNANYKKFDE